MNYKKLSIVLLGAPGVGKGTQAALIKEKYGFVHLSTGMLFREEISKNTEIGKVAKSIIEQGHLCSDDLTLNIVHKHVTEQINPKGFIFDGVPRTIEQAMMMDGINYNTSFNIDLVINLTANDAEIVERIKKRMLIENRADDALHIFEQRLFNYEKLTAPLISYYQNQNKLIQVDGMGEINTIFMSICKIIDKYI